MPTLQIRNIPDETYTVLKERAKRDHRSLQQEALWLLETTLVPFKLRQPNWDLIDRIREQMAQRYGTVSDSTPLIRQMRDER